MALTFFLYLFCSLKQLVELFLKTTERWMVPAGSFIIVSSASQMASGSLQSYIHDLSEIADRIWTNFGGELEIVPGPPLLLSGTDSSQLVRGLHDLTAWISTLKEQELCTTLLDWWIAWSRRGVWAYRPGRWTVS